jgi:transcriptional regulator with XRE-family HTH domain
MYRAELIQQKQSEMGLSDNKMALLLEMSRPTYTRYKKGHDTNPSLARLKNIADTLGIPYSELFKVDTAKAA